MATENGVQSMWDVPLQDLFSLVTEFYRKGKTTGQASTILYIHKL